MPTNEGLAYCRRCDREHSAAMPHDDEFTQTLQTPALDRGWKRALDSARKTSDLKVLPRSA